MSATIASELAGVRRRIEVEELDLREAALQIGVGRDVLARHLAGEYVRSDSLAKYRRWLGKGVPAAGKQLKPIDPPPARRDDGHTGVVDTRLVEQLERPGQRHLVVDLFSGCGGMSLGFDLLESGSIFETVLAIDVEEPMVRVFNANHPRRSGGSPVCRRLDLSDVLNEAEVLGLYLDHFAALKGDRALLQALEALPGIGIGTFRAAIGAIDADFVRRIQEIRGSVEYQSAQRRIPSGTLGQTSVIGFHAALGLPMPSGMSVELPPLIWADRGRPTEAPPRTGRLGHTLDKPSTALRPMLVRRWNDEVAQLRNRAEGLGRGQLASSATRIRSFISFLDEPVIRRVRDAWVAWQSHRHALRGIAFDERAHKELKALYQTGARQVSVLLGGPPCQGFSRSGRGKIRSLREQQVHVQVDPEAGDTRNRLLHKYVLFLSALSPVVFLFENVRHFQAEVRTPEGTYLASDILAEAIRDTSSGGLRYEVANRILDASKHLIPENRERFFMAGVRSDVVSQAGTIGNAAAWCLALPEHQPLPVRVALDGLPAPIPVSEARASGAGLEQTVEVPSADGIGNGSAARLMRWLRQEPQNGKKHTSLAVDSHHTRLPRKDDAGIFDLFGPGKRWMDYRCDESETLRELQSLISVLQSGIEAAKKHPRAKDVVHKTLMGVDVEMLQRAAEALDGSLSLRLLLETIPPLPGELRHHLITPTYLSKREGNHGDWLARLHADRPSKTIVSHMAKDTYAYVHPYEPRTLSVREAARIQTFPDWYSFGALGLVEAFRVVGNAVPPFLSHQLAERVAQVLQVAQTAGRQIDHESAAARG